MYKGHNARLQLVPGFTAVEREEVPAISREESCHCKRGSLVPISESVQDSSEGVMRRQDGLTDGGIPGSIAM